MAFNTEGKVLVAKFLIGIVGLMVPCALRSYPLRARGSVLS